MTPYLTIKQAAELANVAEVTVRREIRRRKLNSHKVGRVIRISREDFQSWMAGTSVSGDGEGETQ